MNEIRKESCKNISILNQSNCSLILILCFFMIHFSCQTVSVQPQWKPGERSLFSQCLSSEGAGHLSIDYKNSKYNSIAVDWISHSSGLEAEAYDYLGGTIARLQSRVRTPKSITLSLKKTTPVNAEVDKKGRILFDGYYLGINLDELPCLFQGLIPYSWQNKVISYQRQKYGSDLVIESSGRTIHLNIQNSKGSAQPGFCANISWSYYWGLVDNSAEYCALRASRTSVLIKYENGASIIWIEDPKA